ncbi:hypothetical protein [Lentilactobacillus sp. Marseille-Q4993]|uniref:hypothetical protein n=1 Tax=Lentilactobacillus sp. Marseille-Q4993 TaxID=3039492 RepID=UPI0024BC35F9|nr:hypothetical protein [Lentilactobacillus sp. Marseille-Q4993]
MKSAERVTAKAVISVLNQLSVDGVIRNDDYSDIVSEDISDVWGRGVMAFEYKLAPAALLTDLDQFKSAFKHGLVEYSKENYFDHADVKKNKSIFIISDSWLLDDVVHFDVAFLINQTTIEYVNDLRKLK